MNNIPIVDQLLELADRKRLSADSEVRGCARDIKKAVRDFNNEPTEANLQHLIGLWSRGRRLYWQHETGPHGEAA